MRLRTPGAFRSSPSNLLLPERSVAPRAVALGAGKAWADREWGAKVTAFMPGGGGLVRHDVYGVRHGAEHCGDRGAEPLRHPECRRVFDVQPPGLVLCDTPVRAEPARHEDTRAGDQLIKFAHPGPSFLARRVTAEPAVRWLMAILPGSLVVAAAAGRGRRRRR